MSTLKESMQTILDKMNEVNFTISRNNKHVGEAVGIVVKKTVHISYQVFD